MVLCNVVSWLTLDGIRGALPYALAVAASSLLYISVAASLKRPAARIVLAL